MLFSSCNEASKKDMGDASENIKEANGDMKEAVIAANDSAKAAAIADWKSFKSESDTAVAVMDRKVAMLEAKMVKANKEEKEKLRANLDNTKKQLNTLKQHLKERNTAFENEVSKFDATVTSKNQAFQREFRHDMDQLGNAFKDLFKDNVK
jgi:glutathione S-transferase